MPKLKQMYNLAAMDRFCDSAAFQERNGIQVPMHIKVGDSVSAGVVLARNLTQVDPTIFEKKYPELAFMNSGINVDNTGGYARRIQSLRLVDQGGFRTAGDAAADKGKISLRGEDSTLAVLAREAFSTWQDDEIKEAELQGVNLPQRYVATHNRLYQREMDQIGLVGLAGEGIPTGLGNYTGFATSSASGAVETLTAAQMYDEIATLITDQRSAVNNTPEYMATRVLMPVRVQNKLMATILNTANGSMSVYRALEQNFPDVQFAATFRFDTTANGGDLATSATVAYNPNAEAMKMRVPVPLTIGEIIKVRSFDFQVDSKYRIAGLDVLEDTASGS